MESLTGILHRGNDTGNTPDNDPYLSLCGFPLQVGARRANWLAVAHIFADTSRTCH